MDNLYVHIKKSAIISIGMIGLTLLIWFVNRSPIALGFAFGCIVGMLNTYILYRNISYISEVGVLLGEFSLPQNKQPQDGSPDQEVQDKAFQDKEFQAKARQAKKKKKNRKPILGLGTRIFFVIGALYIAQKFDALHLIATFFGIGFTLFLSYAFIFLDNVLSTNVKGGKV